MFNRSGVFTSKIHSWGQRLNADESTHIQLVNAKTLGK